MSRRCCSLAGRLAALAAGFALGAVAAPAAAVADEVEAYRLGTPSVQGGEGWRSENMFRVSWAAPVSPGPGPFSTRYLFRDATGAQVGPEVHLDGELGELKQLAIPPPTLQASATPGRYTLEVWLRGSFGDGPHASATLRFDDARPAPARALSPASWIRAGTETTVAIEHPAPLPASGIRGYAVLLDHGSGGSPCAGPESCTEAETDLRSGLNDDVISLGPLAEGINVVRVLAVSNAGLRSSRLESTPLHVDGTEPAVSLSGVPQGWSNQPVGITATATDPQSGMVPAGPQGPLTAIVVDAGAALTSAGDSVTTTVRGSGAHRVSFYARDAVGNSGGDDAAAGPPASALVRVDEDAPQVSFARAQIESEPERIEVTINDALSGPSSSRGSIAVRPTGSVALFEPIPTRVSGDKLTAIWDSDSYPEGGYEFSARGYDAAGNTTSSNRRSGGARMVLANPLKRKVGIEFGFGGALLVWHRCGRTGGQLRCHRQVIKEFERRPAQKVAAYGRGVPIAGRLTSTSGVPLAELPVRLVETFAAGAGSGQRTTTVETAADGAFLAHLAPGPSRAVRVSFAGNRILTRVESRALQLKVRTAVRLQAATATARIGGPPVVFRGRIAGREATIPADGRPVQLQFRLPGGDWTEFRTVQTDAQGRFRYPYSFSDDDSRGVRFLFRAYAPAQPSWPYEAGASLPVAVTGR